MGWEERGGEGSTMICDPRHQKPSRRHCHPHPGSIAGNLEQVDNLLCAQINSASYPQWDGK